MNPDDLKKSPAEKRSVIRATAEQATGDRLDSLFLAAVALADPGAPVAAIDKKELKRRAETLSSVALSPSAHDAYGRVVCRFCGKLKDRRNLRDHIRQRHALDVMEMPSTAFVIRLPGERRE